MRQIPSVTETMVPTLRASVTDLKFSIRCLIRSLISVALIAIFARSYKFLRLSSQVVRNSVQLGAQRAVDDQVTRLQYRATQEGGVGVALHANAALQFALQGRRQRLTLAVIQRRRGGHRHVDDLFRLVLQLVVESRDLGEVTETVILGERAHEVRAVFTQRSARDVDHQLCQLAR